MGANSGTYEVRGNTLIRHTVVAKAQGVMDDPEAIYDVKVEGNTLLMTQKTGAGRVTTKLVRVE